MDQRHEPVLSVPIARLPDETAGAVGAHRASRWGEGIA
jgi:hypothetical protein